MSDAGHTLVVARRDLERERGERATRDTEPPELPESLGCVLPEPPGNRSTEWHWAIELMGDLSTQELTDLRELLDHELERRRS